MVFMTRWQVSMRPPCTSAVPLAASTRCCRAAFSIKVLTCVTARRQSRAIAYQIVDYCLLWHLLKVLCSPSVLMYYNPRCTSLV